MLVGKQNKRLMYLILVFCLLLVVATQIPRVSAFNYTYYWRAHFSGSVEVTGNNSMLVTPYWDYIGNTSWQISEQLSFSMTLNGSPITINELDFDIDGNPQLTLNLTSRLYPEEILRWDEEWLFTVMNRRPMLPRISTIQSGQVGEIENQMDIEEYNRFTRATTLWKTGNNTLINLAQMIRDQLPEGQQDNVLALIYAMIQWIQDKINRSSGVTEPQYPEETIISQIGDCDDQSNLLIVLLRILGIPSYLTTGHWYQDGARTSGFIWGSVEENAYLYADYKNSVGHGWVMIFVPPWGWLPFDLFTLEPGANPASAYTDSLYASNFPFVTLWQIIASDYIAERRTEQTKLFTYEIHRIELEEWVSLGSIPIIDTDYLVANMITLIVLIITLGFLTFLVGLGIRRQPQEEPNHETKGSTQ